ncbi:gamma-glutamyltransferase [Acuticoccus sp. M5D2P5]|uniref:gamma-glutamyltransferase n=1 Tax=Acuticoccus kalidii TaxID=2910977 RepID=UPI001F260095|nr:gamma-glutamyltransferase [Acuticoccus kalidii]MCF3932655.1 gamma-glutamyltransferase [Acuticoccus kalidii]
MRERDFMKPGRSVAIATNGMAATSHPAATLAAVDILRAGGNAVDAAIAAVAVQSVVDPLMTGIGGDCFALYAPANGPMVALNGSGRAPAAAHAEALVEQGMTRLADTSVHAVTVPGAVDAWCNLSALYGRLSLSHTLRAAVRAAEDGFTITPRVAYDWSRFAWRVEPYEASARQFLPKGRAPVIGETIANPALGSTLREIGRHGASAFYEGPVAEDIVATLGALGGLHTLDDLALTRTTETAPIAAAYRGHTLNECPPNGQGLTALIIARILDGFDLSDASEVDRIHLLAEATKLAYRQRDAIVADPDYMGGPAEDALDEAVIATLRQAIDMTRAGPIEAAPLPVHKDTVTLSVVDRDGNAITLINSIFFAFGSGIYAPKAGVLLHNRGAGFTLKAGHPNALGPRKRPLHTIIPAILSKDGRPAVAFGVMGGQYQAAGHVHFVSQLLDHGLDVQMASDAPRSFYTDGAISLEPTISDATRAALEDRGHKTRWADSPLGGCQAVAIDEKRGVLWGASDHRKDGMALGY